MRLIDVEKSIDCIGCVVYDYCRAGIFKNCNCIVENIFDSQPIAYDVNKVIDELVARKEEWERGCDEVKALENAQGIDLGGLWRNLSGRAYGVKGAIDIVKRGGVDDIQRTTK